MEKFPSVFASSGIARGSNSGEFLHEKRCKKLIFYSALLKKISILHLLHCTKNGLMQQRQRIRAKKIPPRDVHDGRNIL
jgi:hypothetical protein